MYRSLAAAVVGLLAECAAGAFRRMRAYGWSSGMQASRRPKTPRRVLPRYLSFAPCMEAFRSQAAVDGIATAEAMAYLLDVAILIGDAELARCCTKHCTRLPLRRWRGHELVRIMVDDDLPCRRAEIREKDALAAGLELEHLKLFSYVMAPGRVISLAEAIVLSADAELRRRVEGLQLQLGPWSGNDDDYDEMAICLLDRSGGQVRLSSERLHRAKKAGLALSSFRTQVPFDCQRCDEDTVYSAFSLLDLAILFGQSDCARLCGPMDIEATKATLPASLDAMPLVWEEEDPCYMCRACTSFRITDLWAESIASLPERRATAAEALRAALQASRRTIASSAGFGLFQAMQCWARGKSVPMALVNLVLTFAAERPSLLQALEGREGELPPLGHWWEESEHRDHQDLRSPQPMAESTEPHPVSQNVGVTEWPPAASSSDAQAHPDSTSEKENGPDQDTTDDLLTALRNSKSDNPPLSGDGVVIFRLTRKSSCRGGERRPFRCHRALVALAPPRAGGRL